jgi:hypothetical protein
MRLFAFGKVNGSGIKMAIQVFDDILPAPATMPSTMNQ